MLKIRFVSLFLTLCFAITARSQTYCSDYNFVHNTLPNSWVNAADHITGAHSLAYYFANRCDYHDVKAVPAQCGVQQDLSGHASQLESGSVGGIFRYHQAIPVATNGQAYAVGRTQLTGSVGIGVWSCSALINDCGSIGITIPPLTVSGPNIVDTFSTNGIDVCPSQRSTLRRDCSNNQCGGGTPLMANLSGLGPFKLDAPGSENNVFQLTDILHGIPFDLLNIGHPQNIAWLRRGSHMAVLVLPNDRGKIVNSNQLFGDHTRCALDKRCENGFAALAYKCDDPINSGNGDGRCDKNDANFAKLRWMVRLKNGKHKLYTMEDFGVQYFDVLVYQALTGKLRMRDSNENVFAFKGAFDAGWKSKAGGYQSQVREIYDVMLRIGK